MHGEPRSASTRTQQDDTVLQAVGYHQQTKHHFFRYARSLGYMDWANQPDPFRRFEGAPLHPLPVLALDEDPIGPAYEAVYASQPVHEHPVTRRTLSRFFDQALAITAWKEAGGVRWALRSNPSSGNLHPTEGYLLIDALPDLHDAPALYHYAPKEHALERRADWPRDLFAQLSPRLPRSAFLVGVASVHWREAWKYGERAYRYCQHDVGHALGAIRMAARTMGWKMVVLEGMGDEEVGLLLGLDRSEDFAGAEREHPDCLALVWSPSEETNALPLAVEVQPDAVRTQVKWHGRANRLSRQPPDPWDIIDVVTEACWKPAIALSPLDLSDPQRGRAPAIGTNENRTGAGEIIRRRRSALAFDGSTSIPAGRFYTMMQRVLPHHTMPVPARPVPWDAWPWDPSVDLGLFVHRVEGLAPGLYWLARDPQGLDARRSTMHDRFAWMKPAGCPDDLPLFVLEEGDAQRLAAQVSCHQEIAGAGAFSLGMVARFESTLQAHGAWFYRRLFWETGIIGQVLYLEAEAAGVRATGIGCFFDDPVHQVFGLTDLRYQSLYHFTVGGPVEDPRLTTLPAYHVANRPDQR